MSELFTRLRDSVASRNFSHVSIVVSKTGLEKSILDANQEFRSFLQKVGLHDFNAQTNGAAHKVKMPLMMVTLQGKVRKSVLTLYRSRTRGDARFWIQGLTAVVQPGDYLLVIYSASGLLAVSGSGPAILEAPTFRLLEQPVQQSIFEKLLVELRQLGEEGFMLAPEAGSSSIGRLLEDRLGIPMNSSKNPDYHGIEIKSSRSPKSRVTMFSQVPDWELSRLKSSSEILRDFGYETSEGRKLSCTLSVPVANSQSLFLYVDRDRRMLRAQFDELNPVDVVLWPLEVLEQRFMQKHAETAWVDAVTRVENGREYVRFVSVEHTSGPQIGEFMPLLRRGLITVDFLIRETGDKGYLFKVSPDGREKLFSNASRFRLSAKGLTPQTMSTFS